MTFYFFDLETSGFSPSSDRIMQFAGQRTDENLDPVGAADNLLVKMTADILPEPGAVLVHRITPQKTLAQGISEAEFSNFLIKEVCSPGTVMVVYNNIRFDNSFIRFTLWRNFHDAYEWSWKDNCSTWDLLDPVRMIRALRPEGLKWPFAPDGKPSNRLEHLAAVNGLKHTDAHDAASDVTALVALARLLKKAQPELYDYLLNIRDKRKVAPLVTKGEPLIYTSGRYPAEFHKTTIAVMVAEKADKSGALMYDLRIDPDEFSALAPAELAARWRDRSAEAPYFPVKELKYNKCPAIAPLTMLIEKDELDRLQLHESMTQNHLEKLRHAKGFETRLLKALDMIWPKSQAGFMVDPQRVDGMLYEGFVKEPDKVKMSAVRAASPNELSDLQLEFDDDRLTALLPLYKARNFAGSLTPYEKKGWDEFRRQKLHGSAGAGKADKFFQQIDELKATPGIGTSKQHLLNELQDYGKAISAV